LIPHSVTVEVGHDSFYPAFNGAIRDVNLAWGPESFKTAGFGDLSKAGKDPDAPVIEEDNVWKAAPTITANSHNNPTALVEVVVPDSELAAVKEYSYSFWSKFSFTDPTRADLNILRTDFTGIAGVTEKDSCR